MVAFREEARQAAETALAVQPKLDEAVVAEGHYHYVCLKDHDTAVRYYEQARPLLLKWTIDQIAQELDEIDKRLEDIARPY
jgi:hypothetical protein